MSTKAVRWLATVWWLSCGCSDGTTTPGAGFAPDDLRAKALTVCARAEAQGCPVPNCQVHYDSVLAQSHVAECGGEYAAHFDCVAQNLVCDAFGAAEREVAACTTAKEAREKCTPRCSETFFDDDLKCTGKCGGKGKAFKVECLAAAEALSCTCPEGSAVGTRFGRDVDVDLRLLAAALRVSLDRLTHVVSAQTSMPLRRHALWQRVLRVLDAGARPATLASAAADAGFADHAHMTRSFRRFLGRAPSEFRAPPRVIEPWELPCECKAPRSPAVTGNSLPGRDSLRVSVCDPARISAQPGYSL